MELEIIMVLDLVITMVKNLENSLAQDLEITMEQVQETIMVCVPWQVKVVILLPAAQALAVSWIFFPTLFFVVLDLVITMAQDQEISLAQDLENIMVLDLVITMVQNLENSLAQDLEITMEQVQETIMLCVPWQVKVVILLPA